MIHEFKKEYLDLPLKDYVLTFDDGLRSPLAFWKYINAIDTEKIFFIPTCGAIEGRNPDLFLNLDEIEYLSDQDDTFIGGHSHNHKRLSEFPDLISQIAHMTDDTEKMCEWFDYSLGYFPMHFCFPYNEESDVYRSILKHNFHIPFLFGKERIDIKELYDATQS